VVDDIPSNDDGIGGAGGIFDVLLEANSGGIDGAGGIYDLLVVARGDRDDTPIQKGH